MRRLLRVLTGLAVALALVGPAGLAACSNDSGPSSAGSNTGFVAGSGAVTTVPPGERVPAPALRGKTLRGEPISLADYEGQVVVLNVWGSWCPPCRKEAPELVAASKALAEKDIAVLGIDTRDPDPAPALRFVEKFDVPYPSFYDPDGTLLLGFEGTIPPSAIPSTLVIDEQGRVAARILGAATKRTFVQLALDVAAGR